MHSEGRATGFKGSRRLQFEERMQKTEVKNGDVLGERAEQEGEEEGGE